MSDVRNTLLVPFEAGYLDFPDKGHNWLFLNAENLPDVDAGFVGSLSCEQGFRPKFLALEKNGYRVSPRNDREKLFDGCIILADRVRLINEYNLARAWNAVKKGGCVLFAGDKNMGVQSTRKWFGKQVEIAGSLSKFHAVTFWAFKDDYRFKMPSLDMKNKEFTVSAGMFSASGPDKGSQILVEQFDKRIRGRVADFGAGWGYLSSQLLQCANSVERLELFEADWCSLEAAKINAPDCASYQWMDLIQETPKGPFDWVIMNPPFHQGRAAEPEIGIRFLEKAAKVLPSGGRLLMVANTNLPYEGPLSALFKRYDYRDRKNGFKVIEAVKG